MQIQNYLDVEKLAKHIEDGVIDERRHPILPLTLLCYSRSAVYDDLWDDVTEKCRGLIVADDGTIVSRPFEKFFNYATTFREETWPSNIPKTNPIVLEKLDGSLGILWEYDGFTGVASKGSFQSDHAKWATDWYIKNCPNPQWPLGYTPVFEMICQEVQRHVVLYDLADQLILLALVNNETGEEADYNTLYHYAFLNGLKTAEVFAKTVGTVLEEDRPNKEGYVLSWPRPGKTPLKIKVKHETFLKLQKIVHAASPKSILEALANKDYALLETWQNATSPELALFVKEWVDKFGGAYGAILVDARNIVVQAHSKFDTDRKQIADFFLNGEKPYLAALCFAILDDKDVSKPAWKLVEGAFSEELTRRPMGDPYDDEDKE